MLEGKIGFGQMVVAIEAGGLLDILADPKPGKYPHQKVLVIACDGYAYLMPFVAQEGHFFCKIVIPNRKETGDYLNQGEDNAED